MAEASVTSELSKMISNSIPYPLPRFRYYQIQQIQICALVRGKAIMESRLASVLPFGYVKIKQNPVLNWKYLKSKGKL